MEEESCYFILELPELLSHPISDQKSTEADQTDKG